MNKIIQLITAIGAAVCGFLFGRMDGLMYALIAFMALDYLTGVLVAAAQKRSNGLGHAAYHHVLPGEVDRLLVDVLSKRSPLFVACADVIGKIRVPARPKKLLKVKRMQLDRMFFAWDYNVLHVLVDAQQRSCFDVVVSAIFDQLLDGFASGRIALNFVKHHATSAWNKRDSGKQLKSFKEIGHIIAFLKRTLVGPNLFAFCREINVNA